MSIIKTALGAFHVDCGRYPTSTEGLQALLTRPADLPEGRWRGPYIDNDKNLLDAWGHELVYISPGIRNTNQYDLYSKGPDGMSKSGGEDPDDVNNWKRGDSH